MATTSDDPRLVATAKAAISPLTGSAGGEKPGFFAWENPGFPTPRFGPCD
jgi:hypothetical protein